MQNNNKIRQYRQAVFEKERMVKASTGNYLPSVDVVGGYTYFSENSEINMKTVKESVDDVAGKYGAVVAKELVFTLETKIMDAKVGQAEGLVSAAESVMEKAKSGAREEQKQALLNQYKMAKSQFDFAEKTYKRFQLLYADSIVSQQEMDEMTFKYSAAKDAMNAAKALYDMAEKGLRKEDIQAAEAVYMQAKNVYEEAVAFYEQLDIKAPVSGLVNSKIAEEGEVMAPGFPVITIMIPEKIHAVLNVREDKLSFFKKGKHLTGVVPGLGGEEVEVVVSYIAVMPDFATWAPTKDKGEFDLKTFEVRLKPVNQNEDLRPGMTIRIKME